MDKSLEYGLEIIANAYKKKKSATDLVAKLKEHYNILSVAEHHKKIMNLQWKRVYTTNYDQTIEISSKENTNSYISKSIDTLAYDGLSIVQEFLGGVIDKPELRIPVRVPGS